jgi:Putative prokaryotic signal transducing protein
VDRYEMIPVAFARSGFEAKVIAAQLGSEGVVWELRGDVDGLYPVGGIEVLVPSDEAERARDVLTTAPDGPSDGLDGGLDDDLSGAARPVGLGGDAAVAVAHRHRPVVVAGAMVLVVAFVVVRLLAVG